MKRNVKKLLTLSLALSLLCSAYLLLCGFTEGQRVFDDAGLLTAEEISGLEEKIRGDAQLYSLDIIIVTTRDAQGKTEQAYADDFYDEHAFGYDRPHGDGVLFLIDMDNRGYHISTSGDRGITLFSDAYIAQINQGIGKKLSNARYYEACTTFLSGVSSRMAQSAAGSIDDNDSPTQAQMTPAQEAVSHQLVFLLISVVIAVAAVAIMYSRSRGTKAVNSNTYLRKDQIQIRQQHDIFLRTEVSHRTIPRNPPPSSSTHTSSGGFTHGGGGGSFGGSSHTSGGGFSHGGGGGKF